MVKVKRTYSLEAETVERIERIARETRRDLSAIIDIAVEDYALRRDREMLTESDNGKDC